MTELDRELWLARRLREHGAAVFEGVTDREIRRHRARAAILAHGLAQVIVGRDRDRRPVTYAEVFSRVYGEPLEAKSATTSAPLPLSQRVRQTAEGYGTS